LHEAEADEDNPQRRKGDASCQGRLPEIESVEARDGKDRGRDHDGYDERQREDGTQVFWSSLMVAVRSCPAVILSGSRLDLCATIIAYGAEGQGRRCPP
jgi:hypothetical protein